MLLYYLDTAYRWIAIGGLALFLALFIVARQISYRRPVVLYPYFILQLIITLFLGLIIPSYEGPQDYFAMLILPLCIQAIWRLPQKTATSWVTFDDVTLTGATPSQTFNLTYDPENRLTTVSGAATASFVYDGDGNRVKATVGGVTTVYIGNYFEWSGSTSTMKKYYYAGSIRIAMRTGRIIRKETTGSVSAI